MRKRVNECIAERGRHFQHLIWLCFCFLFSVYFMFREAEHASGMGCVTFRSHCKCFAILKKVIITLLS
jgi:hypothetical protein